MKKTALWLSEEDVAGTVSLAQAIEVLQLRTAEVSAGDGSNIEKALGTFGDKSSLHALGAVLPSAGYGGYKTWINTPAGAKAMYSLFDVKAGTFLALIEANLLGQLRTAAITGVGTRWLASPKADDLALIGSGRQALAQVAAIHAVRPLRRVRVWSRSPENREAFADKLAARLDVAVQAADSLEAATDGASIVTLVTRAGEPFLRANMLAPGAHLNAVGAILPANAEFHADVFDRVQAIAVDDVANVRKASHEFKARFGNDTSALGWGRVRPIGAIILEGVQAVKTDESVSLFKAVGMGVSDLALAIQAYEACAASGRGQTLPLQQGIQMRFA